MTHSLPDLDALWNYDDPAGTEQKFRELLDRSAAAEPGYRLSLLTQIARAQGLDRRFEQGHATLDEVERSLTPQRVAVRVRYSLERGRLFNSSGDEARSRAIFEEAFQLASSNRLDFYAVDAAHMLGIVSETPELQMLWNQKALAMAEQSTDPRARRWAGALYNNMGWTYFEQKRYDQALELFEKGVAFRAAMNQPRELRIARYTVARTLRAKNQISEALKLMQSVYDESMAAGEKDGFFHEELAECLLESGQTEKARPLFKSAYELLSRDPWLMKNEPDRLSRLARLGT
jgi:tetratricopeptide (TPR) repeat protein